MATSIRIRQGPMATMPLLEAREFGFPSDAPRLFIGTGTENYEVLLNQAFNANTFLYATVDNTPEPKTPADVMGILSGQAVADFSLAGRKLTELGTPTIDTDAATKAYVDSVATGLDLKNSCRVATTAALPAYTAAGAGVGKTLTATTAGILTVDGVNTVLGDRILVKNEASANASNHGIYEVTTEGTSTVAYVLTRATDADENAEVTAGMFTFIEEGTVNANQGWVLTTNDPITVDTTALVFTQFSGVGVGATTFVGLTDTPADFTGAGLNIVRVNATATALEYADFAATYLEDVPTNGVLNKAPTSNWAHDHSAAATGVHGAGANTLLHSGSVIDGGTW